jgi:hypothetical protein
MRFSQRFFWGAILAAVLVPFTHAQSTLQQMIDRAETGESITLPKGTWKEPVQIKKALKIRGADAGASVIDVISDSPAIFVESKGDVQIENLTVRWKRETSDRKPFIQAAIATKDSKLKLQNVRFIAPDDKVRCPSALTVTGFSEIEVKECEFEGFDFTIQAGDGARGVISDCIIRKPGHCGITVGNSGKLEITGNIVTGSEFHAVRCTGGELIARNNLIVANKNRGFYLGNKAARGEIINNAIVGNGTGISGFGGSEVRIANNYIAESDFAGIDMRDQCRLNIDRNTVVNNARGIVLFKEAGQNKNTVLINALGGNKIETEGFEKAPDLQRVDATQQPREGNFVLENARGFGLTEPERIQQLWTKYRAGEKN